MDIDAPVMIVTGASRGIGAVTARRAAARGYRVCVNYRVSDSNAERVVANIRAANGVAFAVRADIGNASEVTALFDAAEAELGPLAVLVNNAGVAGGRRPFADLDDQTLETILAVNVSGTILCAREAARRMARSAGRDGGVIINLSSQAAQFGGNHLAAYAASKGAVVSLTIGLAKELAPEGIRVNAVSPGIIKTDPKDGGDLGETDARAGMVPLGRAGSGDEVADAILWLASAEASYVTGVILPVAGGR